jgi:hypothetical protein
MSGIVSIINGKLAQSKTTGKAFLNEMWNALKPEAICKESPDQNVAGKTKK